MDLKVRVGEFRVDRDISRAISRVARSGRISEGPETRAFEREFSKYIGTRLGVAVNSGTSALIAGLTALKQRIGKGQDKSVQVLTTPLTYIATTNAIVLSGMEPVFVDVEPTTYSLLACESDEALHKDKGNKIGLVLPVHLMGYVCDMDRLTKLARDHGAAVFEDSSQAHGSMYNGKRAGSMSDASSFSFYIAHNIQAGELGAVLTNDPTLARHIRKIKANGRLCDCLVCTRPQGKCPKFRKGSSNWDPRFLHDEIGYNFKTMEFPAAIATAQIARADKIADKRRENVRTLNDLLQKHSDLLKLPVYSDNVSYLGYPLVIRAPKILNREKLQIAMETEGVETRPLFGCIPTQQPAYAHLRKKYKGKLPNAEYLGANGFYIGCHQYLSESDLHFVAKAFDRGLAQAKKA